MPVLFTVMSVCPCISVIWLCFFAVLHHCYFDEIVIMIIIIIIIIIIIYTFIYQIKLPLLVCIWPLDQLRF